MADLNTWAASLVSQVGGGLAGLKNQIDAVARGTAWKLPVRAMATASVNLSAPGATLDGITLVVGDSVLIPAQADARENGIWVWNGASSPMARRNDADSTAELTSAAVTVTEGHVDRRGTSWVQITPSPSVGVSDIRWAPFGGGREVQYSDLNVSALIV